MAGVFTVVARIYPKPGREDELEALLREQAEAVRRAEPDCVVYRPHRSAREPVHFLFYEQYRTPEAFEFHRQAAHLKAFQERRRDLVDRPVEVEIYRSLTD
ncbi:MAG TPA: putative quinol monooxygenase [Calidithermus sp.]|jgi:quinol monooxygenase YgiN|nr:putative quinol monooxygenase [Calidithermus sp.]